jgi:Arc/MetJ-type ribon-helix-helix transcriptional regulator
MQIAVVLEDEQVDELDRLVPEQFSSRAEAVRTAVAAWLESRRVAAIDAQYVAAYADKPPQLDDVDSGRVPPSGIWDDLDW